MVRSGSKPTTQNADAGAADANAKPKRQRFGLAVGLFCSVALLVGATITYVKAQSSREESPESPAADMDVEKQKWIDLRDSVLADFSPLDEQLAVEMYNPSSAYWQALQWMSLKDENAPSSQRYAMASIWTYFGLAMEPQLHECQWHSGVTCRDQVVIGLNFTGFPAFQHMTLPRTLVYLSSLEILDLSRHGIQGSIPAPCYKHWTKLQVLDLEENFLTSVFEGLNDDSWPSMMYLNVKNNILSETLPSAISKMTNLRELYLKGNTGLTGPLMEYVVPNLPLIEVMDISRTGIGGTIPDLEGNGSMKNLREFNAGFTDLSGSLPESLSVASNLKFLQVGGTRTTWTGTLPSSYDKLSMLEFVSFNDLGGITGVLPASWGETWNNIYSFDLWGTPYLQGTLPPEWSGMTNLKLLRIMDNQITSTIPTEFGRLTQLIMLTLNESRLTGTMPQEICDLRSSFQLEDISVDCKLGADGSLSAIECSVPDCCTFCSAPSEVESMGGDGL